MMKKLLLPLMMMLATIAVVPGNSNEAVKASAAETKQVEEGYITKNLVDKEKGYVYLENDESLGNVFKNFVNRSGDFQILNWSTDIMNEIVNNNTPVDGFKFHKSTDSDNAMKVFGKTIPWYEDIERGMYYTLIQDKISVNSAFSDWDAAKEQPLEFIYSLDDWDATENLTYMLQFFSDYIKNDFTLPLLKIDGETIIELAKENDSYTFKNYNSRVYLGKKSNSETGEEKFNGLFFVEIPFRSYIQTIEIVTFPWLTDEDVFGNEPTDGVVKRNIYLHSLTSDNSIFSPFNFSNLDFKKGQLTAVSADRANKIETAFGYICDHYNLDYIIIDDKTLLYTQPTGKYYLDNGREQIYNLYLDNTFKIPFNYDSDSAFVNKLKRATEDIDFNITYYSYSLVFDNTDLRENLRDILDDTLRPGGYKTPSISDSDLKDKIGIAPSPIIKQPKSLRRATSSSQVSNAVVDCGEYYAFRYNTEFSVHTLDIKATSWMDELKKNSFLNFEVSDASIGLNVSKINGVIFYYSIPKEDYKTKHSLSMVSGDIEVDSSKDLVFFNKDNYIIKKDKFGYKFYLGPATIGDWNILRQVNVGESFTLSVEGKIHFENITSVIYTNGVGEIINLSGLSNAWGSGYTGVIKEDGTIIIIDKDGKTHPGYHFDPATGVLKDPLENEVASPVVPKPTNILDELRKAIQKICAVLGTIAIVGGVAFVISQVGPTLVMIFKKKE